MRLKKWEWFLVAFLVFGFYKLAHGAEKMHRYDYYDGGVPHVSPKDKPNPVEGPANHFEKNTIASMTVTGVAPYVSYTSSATFMVYTSITFRDENAEVGRIDWGKGKMKFKGNADKAARVFFNSYLKERIDLYIEERLREKRQNDVR